MTLSSKIKSIFQPSAKWSVAALLSIGFFVGLFFIVGFNTSLKMTSTTEFCVSCHEMEAPYMALQKTSHYLNAGGTTATCADCHIPHEFFPKIIRKIQASREVWGHLTGVIDSPEKYAAHTSVMREREIARLRANDSRECRNCHSTEKWVLTLQSAKSQEFHIAEELNNKTCIDCHAGIAHMPASQVNDDTGEF